MTDANPSATQSDPVITEVTDTVPRFFRISVDGERAGLTSYVDHNNQRIFFHTEIDDRFAGRGLAGRLIAAALTETRAAGKRIVPICPFVAAYVQKHHDFDDILDPVTPESKAAVESALG
ncbi:GNAT family N-acetyltransferase [Nocardia sp. NPDC051030]|uniref:GNAT family N-acetyltransferase n=1 Tax=Nocardia sp. NPDC051030 TaxID=3155162 RepID=UPI0034337BCA